MIAGLRWSLFIFIGLPFQFFAMLFIYPILHLLWTLFVRQTVPDHKKIVPTHDDIDVVKGSNTRNGGLFLDNQDDHGAFTHIYFLRLQALAELVNTTGDLSRRVNEDQTLNMNYVSGDVVVSWALSLQVTPTSNPDLIKKVVDNYIKNLGSRSYDAKNNGWVSNRCNNFGINYCPDSDILRIGQPAAGPQYYTTAALLAVAYHLGIKYKIYFWVHWILIGGWYWAFSPVLYTKTDGLWYVRDIVMKSLFIQLQTFGSKWWIVMPMRRVWETLHYHNDLFAAMLKKPVRELPKCMDTFFSQRADSTSRDNVNTSYSVFLPEFIRHIYKTTKYKE